MKLELVDDVPAAVTGAQAEPANETIDIGMPKVVVENIDPHYAQATREHARGVIDAALWGRALSLANGDEAAAVAPYLRARTTMLKLAQQRQAAARRAPPVPSSPDPAPASAPAAASARPARRPPPRALLFVAACVGIAVLATAAWSLLDADPPPVAEPAKPAAPRAAATAAPGPAAPTPESAGLELAAKVEELRNAGNWNVLVLYANEWTRKEPRNAQAWAALSAGYAKLNQPDESFEAAKQAVALDDANPAYLRTLAHAYDVLDRPADALVQVEKLLALDDRQVDDLAMAGSLYLRLGRLPEARGAFDRALGLDPSNRVSSCGAVDVARRQGRTKDADVLAKAVKAADYDCDAAQAGRAATPPPPARAAVPALRR